MKQVTSTNALNALSNFAHKKPCLEFRDYCSGWGDQEGRRAYFRESREITKDLHDFRELEALALRWVDNLDEVLYDKLKKSNGRLLLDDNDKLVYHVGQYFPTEYRPAVNRLLVSAIWGYLNQLDFLQTGGDIRNYVKKHGRLSRRCLKNYFS